jgi:hypothetical protein
VTTPVPLRPIDRRDERAWEELMALAPLLDDAVGAAWCLIGAQMVRIHAALAGVGSPRLSRDVDLPRRLAHSNGRHEGDRHAARVA